MEGTGGADHKRAQRLWAITAGDSGSAAGQGLRTQRGRFRVNVSRCAPPARPGHRPDGAGLAWTVLAGLSRPSSLRRHRHREGVLACLVCPGCPCAGGAEGRARREPGQVGLSWQQVPGSLTRGEVNPAALGALEKEEKPGRKEALLTLHSAGGPGDGFV